MAPTMDEQFVFDQLEELAERFGIQIRYESMKRDEDSAKIEGGLCRLKGKYVLIINSEARLRDKIKTLAEAIKHFDLDQVYIRPALRELLEKIRGQSI